MAPQVHNELTRDSRGSLIVAPEDGVRQSTSVPKRGSHMKSETGAGPGRPRPRRRRAGVLAAVLAGVALLAAACSGSGTPNAGASSGPGAITVQKIDSFAACMRSHGVANFYLSPKTGASSPSSSQPVLSFLGYQVTGVNPQTLQFQSAMKACRHVLGISPPSAAVQHKQFVQLLKSAACMRSHGYPDWPDPSTGPNGQGIMDPGPPAGVDVNSPRVQAAAKACGESLP
jgi:hypothetical protein